jgi:hypothetical protein
MVTEDMAVIARVAGSTRHILNDLALYGSRWWTGLLSYEINE